MSEKKDCEKFTKGFCVPRDLVVNGQLIQTAIRADPAFAKEANNDVKEYSDAPVSVPASSILNELIKRKQKEKLRDIIQREKGSYAKISVKDVDENEASKLEILDTDFAGISGFSEDLFRRHLGRSSPSAKLKSADFHGANVDQAEYRSKICGQIRDYLYNADNESGHLAVELTHEEFLSKQSFLDCMPDIITTYHWHLEITNWKVYPRNEAALDNPKVHRPFHGLPKGADDEEVLAFPPHALDPDDPRSIWCRGLDHKLFAKGRDVNITHVYRKVDCCNAGCSHSDCGVLKLLDPNDAEDGRFYVSTDESCVDLMFKGAPPATELPPQVEYCLGRCENPPIINSGGK